MHIHILGVCGTFMGGIAALASALGHKVTGSDANVYPPMSTQLEKLGITLTTLDDLSQFDDSIEQVVIGNALSRGHPAVEEVLNRNIPYTSGPEWLRENLLRDKWVLAIAGTHGKTTTTSMLTWILDYAGMDPSFLIGGVAQNFGLSARFGSTPFFVIEADEYDTAFFDKRAKCVHYLPKTFVINNLEYDHADIYPNLAAIQTQLHHAIRTVPSHGCVISSFQDEAVKATLKKGCWSEKRFLHRDWHIKAIQPDYSEFLVHYKNEAPATVKWSLFGEHNMHNGAMAIAAAHHVGVAPNIAAEALADFINVKRRMELRGTVNGIKVYDDFAHHPTAIKTSLSGMKKRLLGDKGEQFGRLIAIIEPRSNTMKMGVHKDTLVDSWQDADEVWLKTDNSMGWLDSVNTQALNTAPLHMKTKTDEIVYEVAKSAKPSDTVVVMSNGGFDNIHNKLLSALNE